ncbi:tannase/feruloyl esterase family alpha/beta hydrolase [Dactylosporangium sp. NPDC049742]|uniref:tannase/feruloyl esterase family alpha/beta hydrolase n=1 Tax=Dactylosporangium sp. NPDC049742 TaxID=3154737 RepID=UPI00341F62EE
MGRWPARLAALLLSALLTLSAAQPSASTGVGGPGGCPSMARPPVPGARILSMTVLGHRVGVPALGRRHMITGLPAFCEVTVLLTHGQAGDRVRTRLWLPLTSWNGRFQAVGGGGFTASGSERALARAIHRGYAAGSTDAGVRTARSGRPSWALHRDRTLNEALLDNFAYRSVHELSVIGKQLMAGFYGRPPAYSYWNGCSTGGRQGLMEAQRYPTDFDGILAAAPAINWDRLSVAQFWPQVAMNESHVYPTTCEFDAFNRAAVTACGDAGAISRPEQCGFDPNTLVGRVVVCHGRRVRISRAAADVVRKIWDGPHSRSGTRLWYGLPRGAPFNPLAATAKPLFGSRHGAPFPVTDNWIRYFVQRQPGFDTSSIDRTGFERLFQRSRARYNTVIGTDDPDLSAFRAAGGKMITWHGLADPIVLPQGTTDYRRRVEARTGTEATDAFFRVFLAPGVGHCSGGRGPVPTDPLAALVGWVEHGHAPDTLPAVTTDSRGRNIVTNLCRYPQITQITHARNAAPGDTGCH